MSRLCVLPLILSVVTLIGCASANTPAEHGNSPAERVRAAKATPLSSDPSSPLNDVYTKDGTVGLAVKKF